MEVNTTLTVLGTGNASVIKCYNTCFVLCAENKRLLVDGGGGNTLLLQLNKADIKYNDIHDIFLTHAHTDHILGVVWIVRMIAQQMRLGKYEGILNVYGNDKAINTLSMICKNTLPLGIVKQIEKQVVMNVLNDGDKFSVGKMHFTAFDIHSTKEKQFGFHASLPNGLTLACLGDEPYNDANHKWVANVDWLLCEAFCLKRDAAVFHPYEKHHSTAFDAAQKAQSLGVKNLLLYHTEDKTLSNRKKLYTSEAKEVFSGNVLVPNDLEQIQL